jgi:hypothetical protein
VLLAVVVLSVVIVATVLTVVTVLVPVVVVVAVVMAAVMVVMALLVCAQALLCRRIHRRLDRPLAIKTFLGLAGRPHTQQATKPEPPTRRFAARRAGDRISDR